MKAKDKIKPIENKIFDWVNWDQPDTCCFCFEDCTMTQDFGKVKKGERFSSIIIDYEKSIMIFREDPEIPDSETKILIKLVPEEI